MLRRLPSLAFALLLMLAPALAGEWPALRETDLRIAPGSPLDFTGLMPNAPITTENRLVVSGGRFAHADAPDVPQPLFCATLAWSPASGGFPNHADADAYAEQLAMRGYNIARFHFTDASLMVDRTADFDIDPETFDRLHYLLAALKKRGIAWIFDGLSSWRGLYGGFDDRWDASESDLKLSVLIEAQGFAHWRLMVETVLGVENPYTGTTPLADPALALVVLVNEGNIEFDSVVRERDGAPHYSEKLQPLFAAWLAQRYADTAALARAWGGLAPGESLEAGTIGLPANRYEDDARMADLQAFFTDIETGATARMSAALRALGYEGAITSFNNWPSRQASLTRGALDVVTMNVYHDWVGSYDPGTSILQQSSLATGLDYLRIAAATRWFDKPFLLTEYDHLFWNRYRYEAGLAVPVMAALQGWDGLCRHAHDAIVLRYGEDAPHKKQILPYAIALDPVARAGETLAALLFRRGDVAPSPNRIALPTGLPLGPDMQAREPDELTRHALVSAIGLVMEGETPDAAPDASAVQSDTGEIGLDSAARRMTLVTPRSVAVAFDALAAPFDLGPVRIEGGDDQALFSLSSLDGLPLTESRKLLAILATDAHNTGMRFADTAETTIADFGVLPVRLRPATLRFSLPGAWTLAPVGIDGRVHDALSTGTGDLRLDTNPASGPTPYFLITRD